VKEEGWEAKGSIKGVGGKREKEEQGGKRGRGYKAGGEWDEIKEAEERGDARKRGGREREWLVNVMTLDDRKREREDLLRNEKARGGKSRKKRRRNGLGRRKEGGRNRGRLTRILYIDAVTRGEQKKVLEKGKGNQWTTP